MVTGCKREGMTERCLLAQERLSLFVELHPVQKAVVAGSTLSENLSSVLQHSTSSDDALQRQ